MRSLLISIAGLALLLAGGFYFTDYTDDNFHAMARQIEEETVPLVAGEDWEAAAAALANLSDRWEASEKVCAFFMDGQSIGEIEYSLARCRGFLEGRDAAAALGELYYLQKQLLWLYENELVSLENMI